MFDAFGTIGPIRLDGTGIVSPLLTMVARHLIGPIESAHLTTDIGAAIFPSIGLTVLLRAT